MGVYHAFSSAKPDPANTPANQASVWASHWNADHEHPDFLLHSVCCRGAAMAAYVVPGGTIELLGQTYHRTRFDLTYVDAIRLNVNVAQAGYFNAMLRAQWSNDGGATWNAFTAAGSNPIVPIRTVGAVTSGWQTLSAAAKAAGDVLVRFATSGGDGIATTKFGLITLHVR